MGARDLATERAERGDLEAQVELAESLAAAGRGEEAAIWLERAADAGHAYAATLLGAWEIFGQHVECQPDAGVARVLMVARAGQDPTACALLADLHAAGIGVEQSWTQALEWLSGAARLGSARALTQLALLQPGEELAPLRVALLWAAASRRLPVAQAMLGHGLARSADPQQQRSGLAWLHLAHLAGCPLAPAQGSEDNLAISLRGPIATDSFPWQRIVREIDFAAQLAPGNTQKVEWPLPRIQSVRQLISADFCAYVIGLAAPYLRRAEVNDVAGGRGVHRMRTNSAMAFGHGNMDVILRLIDARIAQIAGIPAANQEATGVLRYQPGETYADHYDFIDPKVPLFQAELAARGQRVMTVLVYLNEKYEAGETRFPRLEWNFRGATGDALLWSNVDEHGAPELRTLHIGMPPTRGEKWLLSKWIRDRSQ